MKTFTIALIIVMAALSRILPHPSNFTPVAAMALASGAYFGRSSIGFLIPLVAMVISDMIIGPYSGMFINYLAMASVVLLGSLTCTRVTALRVLGSSLAGSVLFFVISNFGVWLAGGLYPKTFAGLVECYVYAIPFFGNTLLGDLAYSAAIFSSVYLVTSSKLVRAS